MSERFNHFVAFITAMIVMRFNMHSNIFSDALYYLCVSSCFLKDHLENCGHVEIMCTEECGATFHRRFLDRHLENDCKNVSVTCS